MVLKGKQQGIHQMHFKSTILKYGNKKYSWTTTLEKPFFPLFSGSTQLECCIYLQGPQHKRDMSQSEQIQRNTMKNQKAATCPVTKDRELRFTLERSRQVPGRPYNSLSVYKEVHKTERKRLFTTISSNTNRSKRFEL